MTWGVRNIFQKVQRLSVRNIPKNLGHLKENPKYIFSLLSFGLLPKVTGQLCTTFDNTYFTDAATNTACWLKVNTAFLSDAAIAGVASAVKNCTGVGPAPVKPPSSYSTVQEYSTTCGSGQGAGPVTLMGLYCAATNVSEAVFEACPLGAMNAAYSGYRDNQTNALKIFGYVVAGLVGVGFFACAARCAWKKAHPESHAPVPQTEMFSQHT